MNPAPDDGVEDGERDLVELLGTLELVSVTGHGEHALSTFPLPLTPAAQCEHSGCLTLHCRTAGRYLQLHLTRKAAMRLSHLLYYRALPDPLAGIESAVRGGSGCSGSGS